MNSVIFQIVVFLVVLIAVVIHAIFEVKKFNENWPPIDDDEFVRRCPEGTDRETALKVRRIISEQLGVEYDQIYPEQSFVEDLDCC